jgi:hypothetical protein
MTSTAQHGEVEGAFVTVSVVGVVGHSAQAGIVVDRGRSYRIVDAWTDENGGSR